MSRRGIGLKRVLKPMIEKKRRDRINQRLDELRTILLSNTADMRLKNPKLEKAEILEITVAYIRRKPNGNDNKDSSSAPTTTATSQRAANSAPIQEQTQTPHIPLYSAGFQECVTRLGNFIESVEPSQREGFVQGLKDHLDGHSTCPSGRTQSHSFPVDVQPWGPAAEGPYCCRRLQSRTESSLLGHYRCSREPSFPFINSSVSMYPKSFVLHHPHPAQPLTHPYPSPPYSLSPPPSPCYSSSSPPYLSLPCHFPFPPSPCQLSPDTVSSSSPPSTSTPVVPVKATRPPVASSPPTPLRPSVPVPDGPTRTLRRSLFQIQPQDAWRPWA